MSHRRIMKSETVQGRVSKDISCAPSDLLSKSIRGPECASMRLVVSLLEANDISGLNTKVIINYYTDRRNLLSIKLDINHLYRECKGSELPGFEVGEFS
jgi:hypothetical protein